MSSVVRKTIFFVLLVGLAGVGYQVMIRPANRVLSESKKRVENKLEKLSDFEKATATTKDLNKQLEQLKQAVTFFESKVPPSSEIYKVLEQITVIAQKQGLAPKTIRTMAQKENSGYVEQPLRLQLEGNFHSFYSFLLELEKLPRIMNLKQLQLQKLKNPEREGEITADCVLSIFFQGSRVG